MRRYQREGAHICVCTEPGGGCLGRFMTFAHREGGFPLWREACFGAGLGLHVMWAGGGGGASRAPLLLVEGPGIVL